MDFEVNLCCIRLSLALSMVSSLHCIKQRLVSGNYKIVCHRPSCIWVIHTWKTTSGHRHIIESNKLLCLMTATITGAIISSTVLKLEVPAADDNGTDKLSMCGTADCPWYNMTAIAKRPTDNVVMHIHSFNEVLFLVCSGHFQLLKITCKWTDEFRCSMLMALLWPCCLGERKGIQHAKTLHQQSTKHANKVVHWRIWLILWRL